MTDKEAIDVLITNLVCDFCHRGYKACDTCKTKDTLDYCTEAFNKLSKIREITERALKSEDPINLYKALSLKEIAEILGVQLDEPAPAADNNDNQITIDDIIEEG